MAAVIVGYAWGAQFPVVKKIWSSSFVLVAGADMLQDGSVTHAAMTLVVKLVALALPPLDAFTQTAWLVDAASGWDRLPMLAAQTGLYVVLLLAAACVDLYRRNG